MIKISNMTQFKHAILIKPSDKMFVWGWTEEKPNKDDFEWKEDYNHNLLIWRHSYIEYPVKDEKEFYKWAYNEWAKSEDNRPLYRILAETGIEIPVDRFTIEKPMGAEIPKM